MVKHTRMDCVRRGGCVRCCKENMDKEFGELIIRVWACNLFLHNRTSFTHVYTYGGLFLRIVLWHLLLMFIYVN